MCLGVEAKLLQNHTAFSILYIIKSEKYEISPCFPDEVVKHSLPVRLKSPVTYWIL